MIIIITVIIVIGLGIAFFALQTPNVSAPTEQASNTNTETPQTSSTDITINIKNFAFSPSTIIIKAGTKVTWINTDSVPHTITSDSGSLLNSQQLTSGQSFSFTFNDPGSVNYHCAIHPTMKGSVVVE